MKVAPTLFFLALFITTLVYQFPVTSVIDVGSGRDAPFVQGFSFRENLPQGTDARWSNGHAEIHFVGVGAQDGMLQLRYAAPRPQNSAQVKIFANAVELASPAPSNDFQTQAFPIGRDSIGVAGDLNIALNSDTFTQPPDSRALGLLVESAQFQANGAPVIPSPRALCYFPAFVVLAFFIARAWSGHERVAMLVAVAVVMLGAVSLFFARVEMAYFLAPLFWVTLLLCAGAYGFVITLRRLTNALPAPALSARTVRFIFFAMLSAFALRMLFAVTPGYIVDTQDYIVWSYKTVTYGLGSMYSAVNGLWISDQSPGLNYILHLMGLLYRGIFAPDFLYPAVAGDPALRGITNNPALLADPIQRTLLRLPQLFADVITGALIFVTARKYVTERLAWLAAGAFWFNPAVLWNGAYWGQTDALHALLILICFLLLVFTPRVGLAFFILGIAAFTKPQAMIFGPLLLLAVYKTSLRTGRNGTEFRDSPFARIARAIFFGALGSALMLLPVVLTGGAQGLLAYFGDTVGHHPILSANAHNLWWFWFQGNIDVPDTRAVFPDAPLSFRAFSIILFGIAYLVTLVKAWRAPLESYFVLGAFLAFAFFMLPTEIHENYGYALLPLLAVALTRDKNLIAFFVLLSATMTLNYSLHDPNLYERFGLSAPDAQWATARWLNALANLIVFGAWAVYLFLSNSFVISSGARNLRMRKDSSLRSE